jgi:hypothetical protein
MHIHWARLFARTTTFITSVRPEARDVSTYTEKAVTAIQRLNDDFYNSATGVWDNAWWSSANVCDISHSIWLGYSLVLV